MPWCDTYFDPLGQPKVTACRDHCFHTCCLSDRPSVRSHFSNLEKTNTKNNRKQCMLLVWLWVWPSGSLMTPVLFFIIFASVRTIFFYLNLPGIFILHHGNLGFVSLGCGHTGEFRQPSLSWTRTWYQSQLRFSWTKSLSFTILSFCPRMKTFYIAGFRQLGSFPWSSLMGKYRVFFKICQVLHHNCAYQA